MADGLRECCKSIRLCHLLIQNDEQHVPHVSPSALERCFARCCCVSDGWLTSTQVHYGKFVEDIADRHVLLMDPVIGTVVTHALHLTMSGTGNTIAKAMEVILQQGAPRW